MLRTKSADPTRAVRTAATNNRVHLRSSSGMRQPHRPEMSSELRILDEERLRVEPERVQLNDIITNRIYEVELTLRNASVNTIKYKLVQPTSRNFRIVESQLFGSIASGLTGKLTLRFKADEEGKDYFDQLFILEEGSRKVVLLEARCKRPQLKFSPTEGMYFLRRNEIKEFAIDISNDGAPANLHFRKQQYSQYTIIPEGFRLQTGQTKQIRVTVQPREVGLHRHTIEVIAEGRTAEHTIDLVYSVVEQSQYLLNSEGLRCKEICFEKIYYGQSKEYRCRLFNNTPRNEELEVKIVLGNLVESGDTFIRNQTPEEVGSEETSRILFVQPQKSTVEAFQHLDIVVVCQPEIKIEHRERVSHFAKANFQPAVNSKGARYRLDEERFDYTVILSFRNSESSAIYCTVGGWCLLPAVRLSEAELDFGRMVCGAVVQKMLLVSNCNSEFPLDLTFKKTAGVQCEPARKQLQPCGQELIEIKVRPVALGQFTKQIEVLLENLFTVVLRVKGEAVAPMSLNKTEQTLKRTELLEMDIERTLELENRRANTAAFNRVLTCSRKRRNQQSGKHPRTSTLLISNRRRNDDTLPHDESFDYGINPTCNAQHLELPNQKDGLFVIRPVDRYQPFKKTLAYRTRLHEEGCISQRRQQPRNHKQAEQLRIHLSGEQLKSIRTSCSSINFGRLFVNSIAKQPFFIINELMTSIQARLEVDHPSLELVDRTRQVIASSERGKFNIVLKALYLGELKLPVRYILNEHHQFQLLVYAQVEQVHLFSSKSNIKMQFADDNLTMTMCETIMLKNQGNAEAHYQVENSRRCAFIPNIGTINERSEVPITIKVRPLQTAIIAAGQPKNMKEFLRSTTNVMDERVCITVKDGVDLPLRIQATLAEPKCYVKETELNFSQCVVFRERTKQFTLRNASKSYAIFEVDSQQLDECLKVEPMLGRVAPDATYDLTVRYFSKKEMDSKFKIVVNLRAGAAIHLPVLAKAVLPNVAIVEPAFNFGTVTVMTPGVLPLTLQNRSELPIEMMLDLSSPAYEGLELDDALEQCVSDDSRCIPVARKPRNRIVNIELEPLATREFRLRMTPQAVRTYNFQLPLFAVGNVRCKGTTRIVSCTAVQAMLVVEPSELTFHKKIIAEIGKSIPSVELLTVRNLYSKPVLWRLGHQIHTAEVFFAKPTEGVIENDKDIKIRFSFNPTAKGTFRLRLPLEVYDEQRQEYTKFTDVRLEGEGDQPQLLFDRPELILPPVPLNVESKACFRIINEGYEHMDITHKLDSGIDPLINVSLQFPQGRKVGINKTEVPVIATFSSRKPISFTAKLEFTDKMGKVYTIPVSGTAEASLLSNYPYFECTGISYKLDLSIPQSIQLVENVEGTIVDKLLTYSTPEKTTFDQPRQFIRKWLKYTLNDQSIGCFPESEIQSRGENLIKLVQLFAGRRQSDKLLPSWDPSSDPLPYYEQLIKHLKGLGCLLNNIRAYYLLDEIGYELHLSKQQCSHKRPPSYKFWFVSYNAWIYLFYQIVAVFGTPPRVRPAQPAVKRRATVVRSQPVQKEKEQFPSNLYSTYELLLLKWMETIWDHHNEVTRRFSTFKEVFEDGVAFFFLVYHHLPIKDKVLEGLHRYPNSRSDVETNQRRAMHLLTNLGIATFADENDLGSLTEKEYLLYLTQLHSLLPCLLPKETIVFNCYLGDHPTKSISIHNPSNRPVSYWVKMEGSADFISEEKQSIRVEAHRTFHLNVTFRSRTSEPSKAFLVLTVRREGTHIGSPLVFELVSDIIGRKSSKILEPIHSRLYESTSVRVPVQNRFDGCDYGEFQVVLVEQKQSDRRTGRDPLSIKRSQQTQPKESPPSFSCDVARLKLKKLSSAMVQLTFMPLSLEPLRCYIVFIDPSVGEFQYEVVGVPDYPKPLHEIRSQAIMIDQQEQIELTIPTQNSLMNKARLYAQQRSNRDQFEPKSPVNVSELTEFTVTLLSTEEVNSCIDHPKSVMMCTNRKNQFEEEPSTCRIKLTVLFRNLLKQPNFDLVLTNPQRTDVRRLKVYLTILPKPVKLQVEMVAPARSQVVQNLPVVNSTDRDWRLRIQLPNDKPQFSIKMDKSINNKDLICKRGSQLQLPLCFQPQWLCRIESKLLLNNLTTSETVEYQLVGIGEEPLSESHINIKCRLNEIKVVAIPVNYPFGAGQTFRVETDLVNCYGAPVVTLPVQKKFNYSLTINPLLSGSYTGAITFYDDHNRYFWYTLTIETEGSAAEGRIDLRTTLFRPVEVQIEIFNPTELIATFETDLSGNDLFGEPQFQVEPKSSGKYKLAFRPKSLYDSKGRISFINEKLGEKSYQIQLSSTKSPATIIPQLRCEIGSEKPFELPLPSHYNIDMMPASTISHTGYRLDKLTRKQTGLVAVGWYRPTLVGTEDRCIIKLTSPVFGTQDYDLEGVGEFPSTIKEIEVYSALNQLTMKSLTFENPFSHMIGIVAQISTTDAKSNPFSLPKESCERTNLAPQELCDIIFHFRPKELKESIAQISLMLNDRICWKYRLRGNVLIGKDDELLSYSTICRRQLVKYMDLHVSETDGGGDRQYDFSLEYPEKDTEKLLRNSLEMKLSTVTKGPSGDVVRFHLGFHPAKPFKSYVSLYLKRATGGVWKYRLALQAMPPLPQETINIETKHGRVGSVNFALPNIGGIDTKWTARIEPGQDSELFHVSPAAGTFRATTQQSTSVLANEQDSCCRLTVSYEPLSTFKNICSCSLVIETQESYWLYEIKGIVQVYRPPVVQSRFVRRQATTLMPEDKPFSPPCPSYKSKPLFGRSSSLESSNKFIIRRA